MKISLHTRWRLHRRYQQLHLRMRQNRVRFLRYLLLDISRKNVTFRLQSRWKRLISDMKICAFLNRLEAQFCVNSCAATRRGCLKCVSWNSYFCAELLVLFQKGIHLNYKVDIDRL